MTQRHSAAVVGIWVLVGLIVAVDIATWISIGMPRDLWTIGLGLFVWILLIVLGVLAGNGLGRLSAALDQNEDQQRSTQHEIDQLQVRNEMLSVLAQSVDVPLAFTALSRRISRLVPCERLGLALLTEPDGNEFQTYTVRVAEEERRSRARPEVMFKTERTAIGAAVRSREPVVIADISAAASKYLDVNVLHSAGFASGMVLPLICEGRAVGTLNLVSRSRDNFKPEHAAILKPVTEMLAMAFVAQQLQANAARQKTMESVAQQAAIVVNDSAASIRSILVHSRTLQELHGDATTSNELRQITAHGERLLSLLDRLRGVAGTDPDPRPR